LHPVDVGDRHRVDHAITANVVEVSERSELIGGAYEALGRRDLDPWHDLLDRKVVWRAVDDGTEFETPT